MGFERKGFVMYITHITRERTVLGNGSGRGGGSSNAESTYHGESDTILPANTQIL